MSFLFGTLVDDGLLSLDETLGDIFPDDDAWAGVTDGSTEPEGELQLRSC
jgi:CubicO group peptidase (beta-lactamase class C family)